MEDDKKKKRNKKKKNKQNKTTEEVAVGADQNPVTNGQNDDIGGQASEKADIQNGQVDVNKHQTNGTESAILDEAERQHLLQKEAILKQTIKQLQNERESQTSIEVTLEEKIKQLQNESDSHKEKVCTLEETIKHLRKENELHMQKEATIEETIQQLQSENDSLIQKEGGLEMNIAKLQSEKDVWLKKESELEEKISRLLEESLSLNVKRRSLEEKIKLLEAERDSWIRMESMSKETIASLNIDVTQLRMQVTDMEECRNNLIQENHQLKEDVSSLQLQTSSDEVKKHTSEQEDFNTQMEAACALVDKLITENVELVEKVNELSVKLDTQIVAAPQSSSIKKDPMITTVSDAIPMSESRENIPTLNQLECTREVAAIKEERNGVNHVHAESAAVVINSSEPDDSEEIVQIPLDDNEVRDVESQYVVEDNGEVGVPLTDAPLIGAPFRFVSFVAKYVSGADLVNNNSPNS